MNDYGPVGFCVRAKISLLRFVYSMYPVVRIYGNLT